MRNARENYCNREERESQRTVMCDTYRSSYFYRYRPGSSCGYSRAPRISNNFSISIHCLRRMAVLRFEASVFFSLRDFRAFYRTAHYYIVYIYRSYLKGNKNCICWKPVLFRNTEMLAFRFYAKTIIRRIANQTSMYRDI